MGSQIVHRLPSIDKAIWNKAGDLDGPIVKTKQARGGSARGVAKTTNIPDEVVLEIRRLYEFEHCTHNKIRAEFPQYSRTWIRSVIDYDLRANLKPIQGEVNE